MVVLSFAAPRRRNLSGIVGLTFLLGSAANVYAQGATTPEVTSQAPSVAAPNAAPTVPAPYKLITPPTPLPENTSPPKANPASTTVAPVKPEVTAGTPSPSPKPEPVREKVAPPKPRTTLAIDIDLTRQRMSVTENGDRVGTWPISSGREGYRSPTGTFRPLWSSKMWYSKKYDNAPMPNAVFFSGGVAMHGTQDTGHLGQPASHGCIRQSPSNAATTYRLVAKHGNEHTKIVVHGTPHDVEPRIARRDRDDDATVAVRPERRDRQYASRQRDDDDDDRPSYGGRMRRVIIVDSYGRRRISEVRADDPRLRYAETARYGYRGW